MTLAPLARVAFALAIPAALALVGTNAGAYARTLAYGRRILERHAFGATLGPEVFGGVGSAAGAFGWLDAVVVTVVRAMLGDAGVFALAALAAAGVVALVTANARARARQALGVSSHDDGASENAGFACADLCAVLAAVLAFVTSLGALRVGGAGLAWFACASFLFASARAQSASDVARARTWIALAIASALVWCELSPYGSTAPLLALAEAVGVTLAAGAQTPHAKRAWTIVLGAGIVTLFTPGLFAFPGLAFAMLGFDRDALRPLALHPIDIDPFGYRNGFVLVAIALAALGIPRARRGIDAWPVLLALVLALENGALLPLFACVAAPALASAAADAIVSIRRLAAVPSTTETSVASGAATSDPGRARIAFAALPWLAVVPAAIVVWSVAHERAVPASAATVASAPLYASTLQRDALVHRIACERPERCGDIVALGDPHLRVLMDERVPAFPASIRTLQTDFTGLKGAWLAPLVRGRTDALVVENGAHVDVVLGLGHAWKRVGADARIAVYVRASSVAAR